MLFCGVGKAGFNGPHLSCDVCVVFPKNQFPIKEKLRIMPMAV
jgi:hypothetical protein